MFLFLLISMGLFQIFPDIVLLLHYKYTNAHFQSTVNTFHGRNNLVRCVNEVNEAPPVCLFCVENRTRPLQVRYS